MTLRLKLILAIVFLSVNSFSQGTNEPKKCDTLSFVAFNQKVTEWEKKIKKDRIKSINDHLEIIRLYTTLSLAENIDVNNKHHLSFLNLFVNNLYPSKCCDMLGGCSFLKGTIAYLKDYDMYIGVGANMHCLNYYTVLKSR
jgi:hypothetical protein